MPGSRVLGGIDRFFYGMLRPGRLLDGGVGIWRELRRLSLGGLRGGLLFLVSPLLVYLSFSSFTLSYIYFEWLLTYIDAGSADTTINLWDTRSNSTKPIQSLTEATDTVSSLHVHNPSYSIASGSYDGRVRVYDIRMGRVMVDRVAQAVTSVRCSGDGNAVLVSSLDSRVRLLDRVDGRLLKGFGMDAHSTQTESGVGAAGGKQYRNTELRIRSVFAKGDGVVLSGSEAEDPNHNGPGSGQGANMFAWDVLTGEVVAVVSAGEGVRAVSCVGWNENEGCWAGGCSDGMLFYLVVLILHLANMCRHCQGIWLSCCHLTGVIRVSQVLGIVRLSIDGRDWPRSILSLYL